MRQFAIAAALAFATGCGTSLPGETVPQASGCPAGLAVVQVYDGFLRIACGCAEAAGTLAASGTPLTCTVASGSQVQFQFDGIRTRHQIEPSGTPAISPSFPADPQRFESMLPHRVTLSSPGTYPFRDAYDRNLSGQLVAL